MGGLTCYQCGYNFDSDDLYGDPENISCPSCGFSTAS